MDNTNEKQELTFGGKAVGLNFNPSQRDDVTELKRTAANFIDEICGPDGHKVVSQIDPVKGEAVAMRKLALRAAQEAQMWAVKAATWGN